MGFLRMIGLVSAEEHAKLNLKLRAATDQLNAADVENIEKGKTIFALEADVEQRDRTISGLRAQLEAAEQVIAALKPDAEAMRAKRKRDREQQAAKKEGKKLALPTATKAKVTAKKGVGK